MIKLLDLHSKLNKIAIAVAIAAVTIAAAAAIASTGWKIELGENRTLVEMCSFQ